MTTPHFTYLHNARKQGLLLLLLSISLAAYSQENNNFPLVRTPQQVTVNKSLPKGVLAPDEAVPVQFSETPIDREIFAVHFFEEPLVPADNAVSAEESKALVYALAAWSQRKNADDFTAINQFLLQYPHSRWQGALLANLGMIYRRTGYFSKALEVWLQSWSLLKNLNEPKIKLLADRVAAELLLH